MCLCELLLMYGVWPSTLKNDMLVVSILKEKRKVTLSGSFYTVKMTLFLLVL